MPGVNAFTDQDHRLNVEDPSLLADGSVADDDEATREWREEPDYEQAPDEVGIRLEAPHGDEPSYSDTEAKQLADAFGTANPSAEEAAMHIEPDWSDHD